MLISGMAGQFTAQVHRIIAENSALMTMVAQEATQRVIDLSTVPKAKGGNMPLVTGFLRASGKLSLTGMPSGPARGDPKQTYASPDSVKIAGFQLGRSIYYGWTAIYARKQNLYNGFLDKAVSQWQRIVDDTIRDLRNRLR